MPIRLPSLVDCGEWRGLLAFARDGEQGRVGVKNTGVGTPFLLSGVCDLREAERSGEANRAVGVGTMCCTSSGYFGCKCG